MNKVRSLKNKIGVFTGGSPLSKERFDLGLSYFKNHNIEVATPILPYRDYGIYLNGFANGSKEERLRAAQELIENKDVDLILSARGGAGIQEILSDFPYELLSKNPKLIIGQSDVTALILQMPHRAGISAIHGPQFGSEFADYESLDSAKKSVDTLIKLLTDPEFRYTLEGRYLSGNRSPNKSSATGTLLAGNLSILISLLGTPFDVPYSDSILIIEEVGESPHKIDRMLRQLLLSKKLDKISGIAFGRFAKCESKHGPQVQDVIKNFITEFSKISDVIVLDSLEVGHWGCSMPVPIGIKAEITDSGINILESPIQ